MPAIRFHYYAEPLPGKRAQMQVDVVIDGRLVPELSGKVGSPAPESTVRDAAERMSFDLDVERPLKRTAQARLVEIERRKREGGTR